MEKITEQPSTYRHLETMSVDALIKIINDENKKATLAIKEALPQISGLISAIEDVLSKGGRMFYLGAGNEGRLSVLDKVELPNTYGIEKGVINCILAGGEERMLEVLEDKEDDEQDAVRQIQEYNVSSNDIVIGISADGDTPFVVAGLKECREKGIPCGCIVHNPSSPAAALADYPVEVITGPEIIAGYTKLKCGSAQKMLFDMISTSVLVRLGKVEDNRMVNVRLINNKVVDRSIKMIMLLTDLKDYDKVKNILLQCGDVKKSVDYIVANNIN